MLLRSPATCSAAVIRDSVSSSRRLLDSMPLRVSARRPLSILWHDAVAMFSLAVLVGVTTFLICRM